MVCKIVDGFGREVACVIQTLDRVELTWNLIVFSMMEKSRETKLMGIPC